MSLFGAMNTATSGIGAQSAAFGNISENVANSQTVGFKRVDTSFEDYLTTSTPLANAPGAVVAIPDYVNSVQGGISQTGKPLNLAISGQGFFAVSQQTGEVSNTPTFSPQQYYTQTGDFSMNSDGYLVNSAGQFLNGWTVDPSTGIADQNALAPIQVSQSTYNPVPTSAVTLSANLPASPATGTGLAESPISSEISVYDAEGTQQTIQFSWVQNGANGAPATNATTPPVTPLGNDWTVTINAVNTNTGATTPLGTAEVQFGAAAGITNADGSSAVPAGTIGQILNTTGTVVLPGNPTPSTGNAGVNPTGTAAGLSFTADFGSGNQTIKLNLGTYGQTGGVTQYAGSAYNLQGLTQNGVPPGAFSGVTARANGNIVVNYDNGQTQTIAKVPVITFNAPDALQPQNGQAFTATLTSGTPLAEVAGTNGAGSLVTESVEGSNVDISTEFSQLIVAQSAYTANTKVITSADQMLQAVLQLVT
jgi:flagellar hook protein FlgE